MEFITTEELHVFLKESEDILLLDLRPLFEYFTTHIPSSISLMFPAILYRRILKVCNTPNTIDDFIMCDVPQISQRYTKKYIVIYDTDTSTQPNLAAEVPLMFFYNYFKNIEGLNVKVLKGGINAWISNENHINTTVHAQLLTDRNPIVISPTNPDPYSFADSLLGFIHIGSETTACNTDLLLANNVTHVLNVSSRPTIHENLQRFTCLDILMKDSHNQNLLENLPNALRFIEDVRLMNGKIFVHCQAGMSRSVSVVMAYMIWTQHMTSIDAFEMILNYRSCAGPNLNFMGQLMMFHKSLPVDTSDVNMVVETVKLALTNLV